MAKNLSDEAKAAKSAYMREYNANMDWKDRQEKNEYQRNWRRNNPGRVKQYNVEYWERKANKPETALDRAIMNHDREFETIEDKVHRLHNEGFSLREIAAKTGINHVKASRILKRYSGVTVVLQKE